MSLKSILLKKFLLSVLTLLSV